MDEPGHERRPEQSTVAAGLPDLSGRQLAALALSAEGLRVAEIAARLHVSPSAAKEYLRASRDKLDARTTTAAVAKALRDGYIE